MILEKLKSKFKKTNPSLTRGINDIGLSFKTYHILRRAGITTVGDLVRLSWKEISGMRRSVKQTCEEVEYALKGLGLKLREEER